ncbi:MAG: tRNA lysidine(34) synthetase TilS, partial [Candidatus Shikimatogenerans sp. JK-2022]|nr:tRNA lysidine(34) synthetase TilS [Candidatus Shikimatogenerans bostrichidophilus]
MEKNFKNFFNKKKYKYKKYLLAVSGGVDSMVLLYIFNNILKLNISVINCFYNINKENLKNSKKVYNFCKEKKIKFFFKSFNTKKFSKEKKISIQMAARELRYNFFKKVLKKKKFYKIILGHHIDDNIETFFINLCRISGIYGLKGINIKNKYLLRPYLKFNIDKKKILKYAKIKKIKWQEDISNFSNIYLRNKIRNLIIPNFNKIFKKFNFLINKSISNLNLEYKLIKN